MYLIKREADFKRIMNQNNLTVAVAESLTSGNIQASIGAISGASTFFLGGITAYSLDQKVHHLKVDYEHAKSVNSVSERVATEMASGVCQSFKSDIGIGTTGYAENDLSRNVQEPYAHFAIWNSKLNLEAGHVIATQVVNGKGLTRVEMQLKVTEVALDTLIDYLFINYQ